MLGLVIYLTIGRKNRAFATETIDPSILSWFKWKDFI